MKEVKVSKWFLHINDFNLAAQRDNEINTSYNKEVKMIYNIKP